MHLKPYLFASLFLLSLKLQAQVSQSKFLKVSPSKGASLFPPTQFHFGGHLGSRIDDCIERGIKQVRVQELIEPFRYRTENHLWQSEFWGKWMLSAAKAYRYTQDTALFSMMKHSVAEIINTQGKDGYIGNYKAEDRLRQWDVWGSKYTLLGLLYFYDLTGTKKVLEAAQSLAGNVMATINQEKLTIVKMGNYRGMAASSILEPMVLLYERTGDARYLAFARYIVQQWETPDGPQLISKALAHIPVSERFTDMKTWWGWENGQKAYEMMSCYDGLLKLYQYTGEQNYLDAVIAVVENIRNEEINIVGSGSAFECWYKGTEKQTVATQRSMETCVTTTWVKLSYELFRHTGNPAYIEEIEKSAYNHLLGALMPDGDRFSMYSSLQGYRDHDGFQCNMNINCCMANGPRGLMLLPDAALMHDASGIFVNFYSPGTGAIDIGKVPVKIAIEGSYPENGSVSIRINPDIESAFEVNLRIPSWSNSTIVRVNGTEVSGIPLPGKYLKIRGTWKKNDLITLDFPMTPRVAEAHDGLRKFLAIQRGPLVLAQDSRFGVYGADTEIQVNENFQRDLKLTPAKYPGAWIGFTTTVRYGTGEQAQSVDIPLVDFSSAGNAWDAKDRFRVWMPVVYNLEVDRLSQQH